MEAAVFRCTRHVAEDLVAALKQAGYDVEPTHSSPSSTTQALDLAGGQWLSISDGNHKVILSVGRSVASLDAKFDHQIVFAVNRKLRHRLLRSYNLPLAEKIEKTLVDRFTEMVVPAGTPVSQWR